MAVVVLIGLIIPNTTIGDPPEAMYIPTPLDVLSESPTPEELKLAVEWVSQKYGLEGLVRTAECESGFKYNAVSLAGEIGFAQFMPSTWDLWNKRRELSLDIYSPKDQINMMVWAWQNNLQYNWTCFFKNY